MTILILIIYVVFCLLLFAEKTNKRPNKSFVFLIGIVLSLIAAFRPETMPDYSEYLYVFTTGDSERMEIGFMAIVEFFRSFIASPLFYFALFAIISISIKLYNIYITSSFFFASMLIYISCVFILHDMIQMRCAIASGLLLFATRYVYKKKIISFLVTLCFALLFHYSAIIILPLWFLNTTHIKKSLYMSMIPIAYMLALSGCLLGSLVQLIPFQPIQNLWNMYDVAMETGKGDEINIFNMLHLARCLICIFILYNVNTISKHNKMVILLVKIYTISLVSLVIFSDIPVIAFRVSELYQVVEVLLIPLIIFTFKSPIVGKILISVISFGFLYINVIYNELLR